MKISINGLKFLILAVFLIVTSVYLVYLLRPRLSTTFICDSPGINNFTPNTNQPTYKYTCH